MAKNYASTKSAAGAHAAVDETQEMPVVRAAVRNARRSNARGSHARVEPEYEDDVEIIEDVSYDDEPRHYSAPEPEDGRLTGLAKVGWLLIGLVAGIWGILGCFLVNRKTAKSRASLIWCAIGLGIDILLLVLFLGVFISLMTSSMGMLSGFENPDYYNAAYNASTSGLSV